MKARRNGLDSGAKPWRRRSRANRGWKRSWQRDGERQRGAREGTSWGQRPLV